MCFRAVVRFWAVVDEVIDALDAVAVDVVTFSVVSNGLGEVIVVALSWRMATVALATGPTKALSVGTLVLCPDMFEATAGLALELLASDRLVEALVVDPDRGCIVVFVAVVAVVTTMVMVVVALVVGMVVTVVATVVKLAVVVVAVVVATVVATMLATRVVMVVVVSVVTLVAAVVFMEVATVVVMVVVRVVVTVAGKVVAVDTAMVVISVLVTFLVAAAVAVKAVVVVRVVVITKELVEVRDVRLVVVVVSDVPVVSVVEEVVAEVLVGASVVVVVDVADVVVLEPRALQAKPDTTSALATSLGLTSAWTDLSQHMSVRPITLRCLPHVHASHPGAARHAARHISALVTVANCLRSFPVT